MVCRGRWCEHGKILSHTEFKSPLIKVWQLDSSVRIYIFLFLCLHFYQCLKSTPTIFQVQPGSNVRIQAFYYDAAVKLLPILQHHFLHIIHNKRMLMRGQRWAFTMKPEVWTMAFPVSGCSFCHTVVLKHCMDQRNSIKRRMVQSENERYITRTTNFTK